MINSYKMGGFTQGIKKPDTRSGLVESGDELLIISVVTFNPQRIFNFQSILTLLVLTFGS